MQRRFPPPQKTWVSYNDNTVFQEGMQSQLCRSLGCSLLGLLRLLLRLSPLLLHRLPTFFFFLFLFIKLPLLPLLHLFLLFNSDDPPILPPRFPFPPRLQTPGELEAREDVSFRVDDDGIQREEIRGREEEIEVFERFGLRFFFAMSAI